MIELQPGDGFVVRTKSKIATPIIIMQHLISPDHEAVYNHAGIILNSEGDTFESLGKIDHYNLSQYKGCQILIARQNIMTAEKFMEGYLRVLKYDGLKYPWWRLALFCFGLADDLHSIDRPVCSELYDLFEGGPGWGVSPDNLADTWHRGMYHTTKLEGVWT